MSGLNKGQLTKNLSDCAGCGRLTGVRAVYAAHLAFVPQTSAEDVVAVAGTWPCRGAATDNCVSWKPGRRTFDIETEFFGAPVKNNITVEVSQTDRGRLWETTWRHPHADDEDLLMVNEVTVAELDDAVSASLVIRTEWARPQVSMPRFSMRAPRLTRDLLSEFEVWDAGHRLSSQAQVLDAAGAASFVDELLLSPERTRPVVFISDDAQSMRPLVDPRELARQLAGMAHVYYSLYGYPAALVAKRLGIQLGVRNGGMRIWWPRLTRESDPYEHRLYSGTSLRDWRGPGTPVETLFRVVSVASATNAAPPAYAELRRAARRAALAGASDSEELTSIAEQTLVANDKLVEQLRAADERAELAALEREEALRQLEELREEKRLADKQMALAMAHSATASETSEFEAVSAPPPQTVLEAVQQAEPQCPHLSFADRAFDAAADCPYEFPEDILEDLLKLERLAALWARPGGIGGVDLAAKAGELGLHWKVGVSDTTTGGNRARQYEFKWRGEKRKVGPHTRRDRGSGAGRIARIYLDKYEPDDPIERLLIVGIVGRKLEDSTT
jgi:hypothetical protein